MDRVLESKSVASLNWKKKSFRNCRLLKLAIRKLRRSVEGIRLEAAEQHYVAIGVHGTEKTGAILILPIQKNAKKKIFEKTLTLSLKGFIIQL